MREEFRARKQVVRATDTLHEERKLKGEQIELKRLDRQRVLGQIKLVQKRIDQSQIIARTSGVVATPHLDQRLGRQFAAGEAVCVLDLTGQIQVRVFVDERDVGTIPRGAPVQLRIAAFPDRAFAGEVREIVRRSLTANGRNSYEVRLRILNPGGQLMPGMTGWAKIDCGRRSWGALLARRVVRYLRTEAWSWF
jgi:multidrug resistance efflux pump